MNICILQTYEKAHSKCGTERSRSIYI